MIENNFSQSLEQLTAFQKIWMESISGGIQVASTISPNSPPPEVLLQIRKGIANVLEQSWEDFMRTPQFLRGMQQFMEQMVATRRMSNDFMGKMRNEMQAPSRDDIDNIMVTVRHIEKRLLDRVEALSIQVSELNTRMASKNQAAKMTSPRPATRRKIKK